MTQRPPDPRRLDVAALAAAGASLEGRWPLAGMSRLLESVDAVRTEAQDAAEVTWRADGEHAAHGPLPRIRLHVTASARVTMTCQRCLGPLELPLEVDRRFGFVEGEAQAAAIDAESEEDVLALERSLDVHALIEDELLLALPLVPRHEDCSPPAGGDPPADEAPTEHPFAALEALRRKAH